MASAKELDQEVKQFAGDQATVLAHWQLPMLDFTTQGAAMSRWDVQHTLMRLPAATRDDLWRTVPQAELSTFLKSMGFALMSLPSDHVNDILSQDRIVLLDDDSDGAIDDHIVLPPKVHLLICSPDKQVRNKRQHISLRHAPKEAKNFEDFSKSLPAPVAVQVRGHYPRNMSLWNKDMAVVNSVVTPLPFNFADSIHVNMRHNYLFFMRILANPATLARRALGHLVNNTPSSRAVQTLGVATSLKYRCFFNYAQPSNAQFPSFSENLSMTNQGNDQGIDRSKSITTDSLRLTKLQKQGHNLLDDQGDAVAWMVNRETCPLPFPEREIEEVIIPGLALRMTGQATFENDGSECLSRGGVAAHHIGYGKTVVTLALLDEQWDWDRHEALDAREKLPLINIQATLVIAPLAITAQWETEVRKFLGDEVQILKWNKFADLPTDLEDEQLRKADIIIMNDQLFSGKSVRGGGKNTYFERLQYVSGQISIPVDKQGRIFNVWYRNAIDGLHQAMQHWTPNGDDQSHPDAAAMARFVEASRDRNWTANEDLAAELHKEACPRTQVDESRTWNSSFCLEMLSYSRIVYDEYSYKNSAVTAFVTHAKANAKWLLSGTPPLSSLKEIHETLAVIGIHVARPEPCILPGLPKITAGPKVDKSTKTEDFHNYRELKSLDFVLERVEQGRLAVSHFYRANHFVSTLTNQEHGILVPLSLAESLVYGELERSLTLAGNNFDALPDSLRNAVASNVEFLENGLDLSRRALVERASSHLGDVVATNPYLDEGPHTPFDVVFGLFQLRLEELATAARQLKSTFDNVMHLARRLEPTISQEETRDATSVKSKETLNDVRRLVEGFRNRAKASDLGGRQIQSIVLRILTGLDPEQAEDNQELNKSINWRFDKWDLTANGFGQYTCFDWYDMSDMKGMKKQDWLDRISELCFIRLRNRLQGPDNAPHDRDSMLLQKFARLSSEDKDIGQQFAKAWGRRDLAEIRDAVRPCLSATSVAAGYAQLQLDIANMTPQQLRTECRRRGLSYKDSDKLGDLTKLVLNDAKGANPRSRYVRGRVRECVREEYPVQGLIRLRGTRIDAVANSSIVVRHSLRDLSEQVKDGCHRPRFIATVLMVNRNPAQSGLHDCDNCKKLVLREDAFISPICGHILCDECMDDQDCPVDDCEEYWMHTPPIKLASVIDRYCHTPQPQLVKESSKILAVVEQVRLIPRDDQIVIFVQFQTAREQLFAALDARKTSFGLVTGMDSERIGVDIEAFKAGKYRTIILQLDREESAGSNLTNANHVIFVSPLVEKDDTRYKMIMDQAKGRCIRRGQQRPVHIYHFIAERTIEEKIFRDNHPSVNTRPPDRPLHARRGQPQIAPPHYATRDFVRDFVGFDLNVEILPSPRPSHGGSSSGGDVSMLDAQDGPLSKMRIIEEGDPETFPVDDEKMFVDQLDEPADVAPVVDDDDEEMNDADAQQAIIASLADTATKPGGPRTTRLVLRPRETDHSTSMLDRMDLEDQMLLAQGNSEATYRRDRNRQGLGTVGESSKAKGKQKADDRTSPEMSDGEGFDWVASDGEEADLDSPDGEEASDGDELAEDPGSGAEQARYPDSGDEGDKHPDNGGLTFDEATKEARDRSLQEIEAFFAKSSRRAGGRASPEMMDTDEPETHPDNAGLTHDQAMREATIRSLQDKKAEYQERAATGTLAESSSAGAKRKAAEEVSAQRATGGEEKRPAKRPRGCPFVLSDDDEDDDDTEL